MVMKIEMNNDLYVLVDFAIEGSIEIRVELESNDLKFISQLNSLAWLKFI